MSLSAAPYVVIGLLVIALGVGGWLLKDSYEAEGALKQSNVQLNKTINDKTAATKDRAQVNQAVRKMAPQEKLEKLK